MSVQLKSHSMRFLTLRLTHTGKNLWSANDSITSASPQSYPSQARPSLWLYCSLPRAFTHKTNSMNEKTKEEAGNKTG